MEEDFEGRLQYGGGFRRRILKWRWIPGVDFDMEADFFLMGSNFFLS